MSEEKRGRGRPAIYPWATWLDGKERKLVSGQDFNAKPQSFRQAATATARSRGLKLVTKIDAESVTIKAVSEVQR